MDSHAQNGLTFRVASLNIRYGGPDEVDLQTPLSSSSNPLVPPKQYYDNLKERPWSERRVPLIEELLWNNVSLVCKSLHVFHLHPTDLRARHARSPVQPGELA